MLIKSLGEPLAGTANIYDWGQGQILKLYDQDFPADWVRELGRRERSLHEAGLPVPAVAELVEIEGCLGQVYERIEGGSLAESLLGCPDPALDTIVQLAHTFAEVHAQIHACRHAPPLTPQREALGAAIRRIAILPDDLKRETMRILEAMPVGNQLCHGDFHPFNVLLSRRGPIVIDWNNAHTGIGLQDVARAKLILDGTLISDRLPSSVIDPFTDAYLGRYQQLLPYDPQELAAWLPVVAAVRLCDEIPALETWLLEKIRTGLAELG